MIILIILLVIEFLILVIAGIRFFIKGFYALRDSNNIKQPKLSTIGQTIGFIGLFIVVGLTRIMGVRGVYASSAISMYLIIVFVGILFILLGSQLVLAAYKDQEENSVWIKWFMKIFK